MFDTTLRPTKDRVLAPLVRGPIGLIAPTALTAASLAAAIGAGIAAWQQGWWLALVLWLFSRVLDGLDGAVARSHGSENDVGGLLDIVGDTIGYAVIPLGIAAGLDTRSAWIAVAVLLATFYVNAVSWTYLAALLEKRSAGATATGASTSTVMPRGFVEGVETILFFSIALIWPSSAPAVFAVMAIAVGLTIVERLWWARRVLR